MESKKLRNLVEIKDSHNNPMNSADFPCLYVCMLLKLLCSLKGTAQIQLCFERRSFPLNLCF